MSRTDRLKAGLMKKILARFFGGKGAEDAPEPARVLATVFKLNEVFTPGQPADKGFVSRRQQESDLDDVLDERGTQALVWGESGAGKSSLVRNVLSSRGITHITTRCQADMTYEQILASAFDRIGATTLDRSSHTDSERVGVKSEVGGGVVPAKVGGEAEWGRSRQEDVVPVAPTQLTAEALAVRLGQKKTVWVIEDFHKVEAPTRRKLADAMKIFSDESVTYPELTIIVLGVSESPADILLTPSNMGGRLADIQLPPLDDVQLGEILDKGKELLNVDFVEVRDRIIRHSVGVASITHALARECCRALDVAETSAETVVVTPEALEAAKSAYVRKRGGEMKREFDKALEVVSTRRYHNYAIILKALASLPESGATHAEILARIHDDHPVYPAGNLTTYLRKLQTDERSSLVRKTAEGLFRYDRPLQHAYAILRFRLVANPGAEFWTEDLSVTEAEQEESARLAEQENLDAPDIEE